MNSAPATATNLPLKGALLYSAGAIICFHLAYVCKPLSFLIIIYLFCLVQVSRLPGPRMAFYFGLLTGFGCALQAAFFWNIFGPAAIALWSILAFWSGLFVTLAHLCRSRFGKSFGLLLTPLLWTGLEYFRSELYYLRFSWLNVGYVFAFNQNWLPFHYFGMYGIGFVLVAAVCLWEIFCLKNRSSAALVGLVAFAVLTNLPSSKKGAPDPPSVSGLKVAGVQLEFPSEPQVLDGLNQLLKKCPEVDLCVLSEYSFTAPIPDSVRTWCRKNHRYLIVGGEDSAPNGQYRDTAFVIGPAGSILFQQAKSVPIQFFKDGLPAQSQKLWDSPWGKIGICICYDLSYTRVTDRLIRMGAQAIIVPSMDVIDWGRHQHQLHARVAPIRAAEYGVPVFRLASSGISQSIDSNGRELAAAPVPGEGAIISSSLMLAEPGTLPFDRFLAPLAVAVDAVIIAILLISLFAKPVKTSEFQANPA